MSLLTWANRIINSRDPDFVLGEYHTCSERWHVLPRNNLFNIYVHRWLDSDPDESHVFHDHPYANITIVLKGMYWERFKYGHRLRRTGAVIVRRPSTAHRIELIDAGVSAKYENVKIQVITLFMTGPRVRSWGFHCPKGWVYWKTYLANAKHRGTPHRGCEE